MMSQCLRGRWVHVVADQRGLGAAIATGALIGVAARGPVGLGGLYALQVLSAGVVGLAQQTLP